MCFIRGYIGIPCPVCGMTRAYKLLLKGNFLQAFYMHPLFIIPIILLIFVLINKNFLTKRNLYILFFIFISVYIYRLFNLFPNIEPLKFNNNAILPKLIKLVSKMF